MYQSSLSPQSWLMIGIFIVTIIINVIIIIVMNHYHYSHQSSSPASSWIIINNHHHPHVINLFLSPIFPINIISSVCFLWYLSIPESFFHYRKTDQIITTQGPVCSRRNYFIWLRSHIRKHSGPCISLTAPPFVSHMNLHTICVYVAVIAKTDMENLSST